MSIDVRDMSLLHKQFFTTKTVLRMMPYFLLKALISLFNLFVKSLMTYTAFNESMSASVSKKRIHQELSDFLDTEGMLPTEK